MAKQPDSRPIDRAIRSVEIMLNFMRMAKQGNYPPAVYAQLMQAIHAHSQTKFHLDAEVAAQSVAWARANSPGHIVPPPLKANAEESIGSVTPEEGDAIAAAMGCDTPSACEETRRSIQQMGGGKIPVEAA